MQKTLIALTIAAVAAMTAYAPIDVARAQKGVPADVMKELAPTGKLRAGINLGNSVLAQKSAAGELGGISVDLARELGKRLGVPVELIEFQAAGQSFEAMGERQTRCRVLRDRAQARRRSGVLAALCRHRWRLHGGRRIRR